MNNVAQKKPVCNRPTIQCLAHACLHWLYGGVITREQAIEHYIDEWCLTPTEAGQLRELVEGMEVNP